LIKAAFPTTLSSPYRTGFTKLQKISGLAQNPRPTNTPKKLIGVSWVFGVFFNPFKFQFFFFYFLKFFPKILVREDGNKTQETQETPNRF